MSSYSGLACPAVVRGSGDTGRALTIPEGLLNGLVTVCSATMLAKLLAERRRHSCEAAWDRLTRGSWQPQRDSDPCLHLEKVA